MEGWQGEGINGVVGYSVSSSWTTKHETNTIMYRNEEGGDPISGTFSLSRSKAELHDREVRLECNEDIDPMNPKSKPIVERTFLIIKKSQSISYDNEGPPSQEQVEGIMLVTLIINKGKISTSSRVSGSIAGVKVSGGVIELPSPVPVENKRVTLDLHPLELKQDNMPNVGVAVNTTDMASPYSTATISSGDVAYITGQPAMPQLKASFTGLAASINIDWKLEIKSERTERGTKDDKKYPASGYKTLPGDQAWDIGTEFGTDFVAGKCKLFYKVSGGTEQTIEFFIRGKNPRDADARVYVTNHAKSATYPYAWAMVQHESRQGNRCYNQFNSGGDGPGNLERPNFTGPDGWGIAQLDKPLGVSASTTEVYEWKKNVDKFFIELDEKEAATNRFFAAVARTYPNDPDSSNPPTSHTVTGTNTVYSAKQLSTMILYNGARGTPVSTLKNGNGNNTSNFQNPWTFNPNRTPKWQFTDNYYSYAFDVINGEIEGTFQVRE